MTAKKRLAVWALTHVDFDQGSPTESGASGALVDEGTDSKYIETVCEGYRMLRQWNFQPCQPRHRRCRASSGGKPAANAASSLALAGSPRAACLIALTILFLWSGEQTGTGGARQSRSSSFPSPIWMATPRTITWVLDCQDILTQLAAGGRAA